MRQAAVRLLLLLAKAPIRKSANLTWFALFLFAINT